MTVTATATAAALGVTLTASDGVSLLMADEANTRVCSCVQCVCQAHCLNSLVCEPQHALEITAVRPARHVHACSAAMPTAIAQCSDQVTACPCSGCYAGRSWHRSGSSQAVLIDVGVEDVDGLRCETACCWLTLCLAAANAGRRLAARLRIDLRLFCRLRHVRHTVCLLSLSRST